MRNQSEGLELGLPVTGGNVSFYNQTGDVAIQPTPVIGVLGVIQEVSNRTQMGFTKPNQDIYLIGKSDENLSGSEWAHLHGEIGNQAPKANLELESRLVKLLLDGQEIFESAHDLSNGGLASSLTESILKNKVGAQITLSNPALELFVETPGRVIVAVDPKIADQLQALSNKYQILITKLGTTGGNSLKINDLEISIEELNKVFTETFPKLFG